MSRRKSRVGIQFEGWCTVYLEDVSSSGDYSILLGTVHINGIAHHVNAIRVKDGEYDGTDTEAGSMLGDFYRAYEQPWQTTKITRRRGEYVILIHPHGD